MEGTAAPLHVKILKKSPENMRILKKTVRKLITGVWMELVITRNLAHCPTDTLLPIQKVVQVRLEIIQHQIQQQIQDKQDQRKLTEL
jgi:hypothetical protein